MDDSLIPAAEIGGPVRPVVLLVHDAGLVLHTVNVFLQIRTTAVSRSAAIVLFVIFFNCPFIGVPPSYYGIQYSTMYVVKV